MATKRKKKNMAKAIGNIPVLEPFIFENDSGNISKKWSEWKEDFELYIAATGVTQDIQNCGLILHLGGVLFSNRVNKMQMKTQQHTSLVYVYYLIHVNLQIPLRRLEITSCHHVIQKH